MPQPPRLTAEQTARLDKKAGRYFWASAAVAIVSWLLVAAVWTASWRLAGVGFLAALPALALLTASISLRSPAGRQRVARQLSGPQVHEITEFHRRRRP
ncbi:hypothetical protein [Sphaerisporangium sp. NPDC051011]|uniref:hypothetical protein n=1 Tax=Sphaerisporangium sp. NPDC051011 TaxID=3155792 RepID=UPI0033CA56FC